MTDRIESVDPEQMDREEAREMMGVFKRHWIVLALAVACGGAVGYGVSYAVTPTFTASALFMPPQQQNSASAAAAALGPLSGLVGGGALKSSTDQYISMMQSATVADRVIKRFDLAKVYETDFKDATRAKLAKRVQISSGKKDGLIRVDVEDTDPRRAAAMANDFVDELRIMTSHLAVTEAQQRVAFFQGQLDETRQKLVTSQTALQSTGFTAGALKVEPRAAADGYAKLRAELTAAQVKLQILRSTRSDTSAEVLQQQASVNALTDQVSRLEVSQAAATDSPDYIGKYREFKYLETLFELYSRQFELARSDEAREGSLIQVIDEAQPAEHKHSPRRSVFAVFGGLLSLLAAATLLWRRRAA